MKQFEANHQILNCVSYFRTFQVLLTGGYDNVICVYQMDAVHDDSNLLGRLLGHMSIVTAFKGIENTPMIVSSDDKYNVKIWDIRTCKCIQSIDVSLRSTIRVILSSPGRVYFQSSRLTAVEFEIGAQNEKQPVQSKPFAVEGIAAVGAVMNDKKQELIVCTTKDVRFFHSDTGRLFKIISILVDDKDDGITNFQIIQSFSRILIGTVKGALHVHDLKSGELLSTIPSHLGEVTCLRIDLSNDLLFSTATDSSVLIQKLQPTLKSQKYRQILNAHQGSEEILFAEVSVHHNIFITCSSEKLLLIWSYEFGRLLASYELEQDSEPVAVSVINGYSIILVSTTKGHIFFIKFTQDAENIDLELIANINIVKSLIFRGEALHKVVAFEVKRAYISQEKELRKLKDQTRKLMKEDAIEKEKQAGVTNQESLNQGQTVLAQVAGTSIAQSSNIATAAAAQLATATAATASTGKRLASLSERLAKIKEKKSMEQRQNLIQEGLQDMKKINEETINTMALYEKDEVMVQGDDSDLFKLTSATSTSAPLARTTTLNGISQTPSGVEAVTTAATIASTVDPINDQKQNSNPTNSSEKANATVDEQLPTATVVQKDSNIFATQLAIDLVFEKGGQTIDMAQAMSDPKTKPMQCSLIVGLNNGEIRKYDITTIFQKPGIKLVRHCNLKSNYNAYRQNVEDHNGDSSSNYKVQCFKQVKNSILKDVVIVNNLNKSKVIQKFQFSVLKLQQIRGLLSKDDDSYRPLDPYFNQSKNMSDLVQAHKGNVRSVDFVKSMRGTNIQIISCGATDNCVKIWNFFGKISLLAALNVTHPLPIRWDYATDAKEVFFSKLFLAIKSQETVIEKFKHKMTFNQQQKFNFRNLLNFLEKNQNQQYSQIVENALDGNYNSSDQVASTVRENSKQMKEKPRLMKDDYTPRDLLFEKIKEQTHEELGGPSLKHLQQMKRVEASKQKTAEASYLPDSEEFGHLLQSEEKNKESKFISAFLHPQYRTRFLDNQTDFIFPADKPMSSFIFARKLDDAILNKNNKKKHVSSVDSRQSATGEVADHSSSIKKNNYPSNSNSQAIFNSTGGQSQFAMTQTSGFAVTAAAAPGQNAINLVQSTSSINRQSSNSKSTELGAKKFSVQMTQSSQQQLAHLDAKLHKSESQHFNSTLSQFHTTIAAPANSSDDKPFSSRQSKQQQNPLATNSASAMIISNLESRSLAHAQPPSNNHQPTIIDNEINVQHSQQSQQQQQQQQFTKTITGSQLGNTAIPKWMPTSKSMKQFDKRHSKSVQSNNHQLRTTPAGQQNSTYIPPIRQSPSTKLVLKKEAQEIFNFHKEIPDTLEKKYISGAEFLIKINSIERNLGMKFQLFEPAAAATATTPTPAAFAFTSSNQNSLTNLPPSTSRSSKQVKPTHEPAASSSTALASADRTSNFFNSQSQQQQSHSSQKHRNKNLQSQSQSSTNINSSSANYHHNQNHYHREFLDYAQEKALIKSSLLQTYSKQSNSLTPAQVKQYFLHEIADDSNRKAFEEKFESTLVSPSSSIMNPFTAIAAGAGITSGINASKTFHHISQSPTVIPSMQSVENDQQQQQQSTQRKHFLNEGGAGGGGSHSKKSNRPEIPPILLPTTPAGAAQKFYMTGELLSSNRRSAGSGVNGGLSSRTTLGAHQAGAADIVEFDSSMKEQVNGIINGSKQGLASTQRKCFQDVMKNLNSKLLSSKTNHKQSYFESNNSARFLKAQLPKLGSTRYSSTRTPREYEEINTNRE